MITNSIQYPSIELNLIFLCYIFIIIIYYNYKYNATFIYSIYYYIYN